MAKGPVTDAERERVRQLHAQGLGRNEIAAELGRSAGTITNIAKALGLSFDRTATAAATEARQADLAALRTQLAYNLTNDAIRLRQQLWQPAIVYNFGGKDNTYAQRQLPEPPARDKRDLMLTAATAIDRSLKLAPPRDDAAEEARSMVGQLMAGLAQVYREQQAGDERTDAE